MSKKHKDIVFVNGFDLSRIINISIASSKIKKLYFIKKPQRPQLHLLIFGKLGTGKSTFVFEVADKLKTIPITSFTQSSIYGTIDKDSHALIPPVIWECRNSCLLLDEFDFNPHSPSSISNLSSLLPILEYPIINKKIAVKSNEQNIIDGDLYLKVKDGTISCKTRFVIIINTMMNIRKAKSQKMLALMSRCLTIPHYPTFSELVDVSKEKAFYEYKEIKVKEEVVINKKTYYTIISYLEKNCKNPTSYLRTLGDCCRIYAVINKHDYELYDLIIKMREQSDGGKNEND